MDELATLIEQLLTADNDDARREALAQVDLDATEMAMRDAANDILASEDAGSDDALETLQSLADAIDHIRAERDRREAAATEQQATLDALAARVNGAEGDTETAAAAAGPEDDPENAAGGEGEGTGDGAGEGTGEGAEGEGTGDGAETAAAATTAAAAPAKRPLPSLARLRAAAPADTQPVQVAPRVTVRASMDVPGVPIGTDFRNRREIAQAMIARREALGRTRGGSVTMEKVPVVQFSYLDELKQLGEDKMLNGLLLAQAAEPDALTASGGFCAPNETVYDFVKINVPEDLVQDFLPTVGAPRGSVEYPDSPDIRDAFTANPSREYTNQNDIDEVAKVTTVVDCPEFNTCTVGAQYVILQFGNFATRAYPEWVEHWVGLSMDVHAHKVSEKLMLQMVALSNAVVNVGPNAGATSTLISNLSLAAADFRQDLRMPKTAQLEIVLPSWTPELIRSDLARASKGMLDTLAVTNAMIESWFAARNLTVRYVTDWQNISANSATGASVWPSGLSFLMYPPGTFVKLDMGTLDLGVVRDSTLNETNDYNIFVETFESVCKPGIESRLYTVAVCANGAFSADQNLGCTGLDIPGS